MPPVLPQQVPRAACVCGCSENPAQFLRGSGGGAVCAIYLFGGVVEVRARRGQAGVKRPTHVLLLALLASTDVRCQCPFSRYRWSTYAAHLPLLSMELLLPVLCLCMHQAPICNGLSSLLGVATVNWFFIADTLPSSLFFDECFAVIATRADVLLPTSLRPPPSCRCY